MINALHNELSADQDRHAKQRGAQDQLRVAVGFQELPGQVGHDQPQEGNGAHHGGRHGDAQRHADQQPADAPVVIHAQIDGLRLAQRDHVQQGQILAQHENDQGQHHQRGDNDLRVDVFKAGHQGLQQAVVLIGIHDAGHGRLDAGEQRGQHRADQQDIQYIVPRLFEQIAIDGRGDHNHQHQIHRKGQIAVGSQKAGRARRKHHRRMDQSVQRVHPQQAGGHNDIVDDGLKHQGGPSYGKGGDQHDDQLGGAELHGILKQLRVAEIDRIQHITGGAQQHDDRQDHQLFLIRADRSRIHLSSPPFTPETAEPQPLPATMPRRTAFRPWFSR